MGIKYNSGGKIGPSSLKSEIQVLISELRGSRRPSGSIKPPLIFHVRVPTFRVVEGLVLSQFTGAIIKSQI